MLSLHGILNSIWMIEENYAANYLPVIAAFLQGKTIDARMSVHREKQSDSDTNVMFAAINNGAHHISEYGRESKPEDAPKNSVAVVSITGAITKYDQDCGPSGMKTKSNILHRCYNNPNIKGIVLAIDSGGGEGRACQLLQETIAQRNKGVAAYVDDFACSAAYGIAAACDTVTLNSETARVGSIGTYLTLVDYTEYYKKLGISLHEIYASKSTDKNKDYYEAVLNNNKAPLKAVCDKFNDAFIASIAGFREGRIAGDQSLWNTGKVFFADEAVKIGLADNVGTLENVINYFNV